MTNALLLPLTQPVVTPQGLQLAPQTYLQHLGSFTYTTESVASGATGLLLLSGDEIDRFEEDATDSGDDEAWSGAFLTAVQVSDDQWLLMPGDSEPRPSLQVFQFEPSPSSVQLRFAFVDFPEQAGPDAGLAAFQAAQDRSFLDRLLRRDSESGCIENSSGSCDNDGCLSGCEKLRRGSGFVRYFKCRCRD